MKRSRWFRFSVVGLAGVAVQMIALGLLVPRMGSHYLLATALAVEASVLHNFFWHRRWTWCDRPGSALHALTRFHLGTGVSSLGPNLFLTGLLVEYAGFGPALANLAAIACCSFGNYLLSDRWVFCSPGLR